MADQRGKTAGEAPHRHAILGWCTYDFANSAFATVIVTFVYARFFTLEVAPKATGDSLWAWGVGLTAIVVALSSPFLGALADRGGYRKRFLFLSTAVCIAGTVALYFVLPGWYWAALVIFVVANIHFELAGVFYNAFLPSIAPRAKIGRISGYGWGLGYIGGLLAMVLTLVLFVGDNPLIALDRDSFQHVRASTLLVAAWFALFSIPIWLWVKEDKSRVVPPGGSVLRSTFAQLEQTFREIRKYRQIVRFLFARLLYNDGLVTIFALGGIYAAGTFGFDTKKLIYFGLLLNVTAGLGALVFARLDDKLGGKTTILITIAGLIVAVSAGLLARSETAFWIAASGIGIFVGPNQAASRSLMGRFVPADKENEFFGFFAFSGKATAFMGPTLYGTIKAATVGRYPEDAQRIALSVVVLFFIIGGAILMTVNEKEGLDAAGS